MWFTLRWSGRRDVSFCPTSGGGTYLEVFRKPGGEFLPHWEGGTYFEVARQAGGEFLCVLVDAQCRWP